MASPVYAEEPPCVFGVDAPELASLGPLKVGVRTLTWVEPAQPDILAMDPKTGVVPKKDRTLQVDVWYPATNLPGAHRENYSGSLPAEPPGLPATFTVPGIAIRDARPAGAGYPLIVVSHGYSNATAAMTWLTENLASKGYVVAAIRHEDPPLTDTSKFPQLLLRRPLDIAFVSRVLRENLAAEHLIDPEKVALVGYSIGGYGALTAAGATLDPAGPLTRMVPGGLLLPYVRGAKGQGDITVPGVKAVVAISPAGGGVLRAWGADGLKDIHAPLLLISGDQDRTVNYATGARGFFDAASNTTRYLLTFKGAGHAIGLSAVPPTMRSHLWDEDWFEDPVWRKERVSAINAHFITAFLDLYVKGDVSRRAYLDVQTPDSDDGVWPQTSALPYGAYSPSDANITVWKGFQRNHATGLQLLRADSGAATAGR
jgi:predicted dienelactone hydrolase